MVALCLLKKEHLFWEVNPFLMSGSFGLWAGLFSISNCVLISLRNKEDVINQIVAGGVTGGLLAFRAGRRIAFKNAVFGALFLAAIGVV
jgi:import inner membrane translocase subunit TIM17